MKIYKSDRAGKREFVREVISPLTVQTRSGWFGARYEANEHGEFVYLLTDQGFDGAVVDVSGDSITALLEEVVRKF